MKKRIFLLLLSIVAALTCSLHVYAHEIPDLTQNGTITFQITWQGEPVNGGTMSLYRVGDIVENDGNYTFALIPELADSGITLEDVDDSELARKLAMLAQEENLAELTAPVSAGLVVFEDVTPGLYVAVHMEAADGFAIMNPFLISMPYYENGVYVTDVVASPKVLLEREEPETSEPAGSDPTLSPEIPQTGQLNWPVPLMAALGMILFGLGWMLCSRKKQKKQDA